MDLNARHAASCCFVDAGMEAQNEIETPISPRNSCDIVASFRFTERVAAKEEEEGRQFASNSQTGSHSSQRFESPTTAGASRTRRETRASRTVRERRPGARSVAHRSRALRRSGQRASRQIRRRFRQTRRGGLYAERLAAG